MARSRHYSALLSAWIHAVESGDAVQERATRVASAFLRERYLNAAGPWTVPRGTVGYRPRRWRAAPNHAASAGPPFASYPPRRVTIDCRY